MVAGNFLCSAAVALFWFTDLRARLRHARTSNHRGCYLPDHISRPHMVQECVCPAFAVRLRQPVGSTFTHLFVRVDRFGQRVVVWVGPLEMPLEHLPKLWLAGAPIGLFWERRHVLSKF
jgi:hypothetical protein